LAAVAAVLHLCEGAAAAYLDGWRIITAIRGSLKKARAINAGA
jgi:hypothetical protein